MIGSESTITIENISQPIAATDVTEETSLHNTNRCEAAAIPTLLAIAVRRIAHNCDKAELLHRFSTIAP